MPFYYYFFSFTFRRHSNTPKVRNNICLNQHKYRNLNKHETNANFFKTSYELCVAKRRSSPSEN